MPEDPGGETGPVVTSDGHSSTSETGTETGTTSILTTTVGDETTATDGDETTTTGEDTNVAECGDGTVDEGESCDDGPLNSDYGACTNSCQVAICGDGLELEDVEVCDDGVNDGSYDSCTEDCSGLGPYCGDGVLQEEHEACEVELVGGLCYLGCELVECSTLDIFPTPDEYCTPEAQANATVEGMTPLGSFKGTFAAQFWQHYDNYRRFLIVQSYDAIDLCQQSSYLIVVEDEKIIGPPGTVNAFVLASLGGEIALTTAALTMLNDDYFNPDGGPGCDGSSTFELKVDGDGWSLGGSAEAGCCWSSDNIWVQ